MASSTVYKTIVDFIWEWSSQCGPWAQSLASVIISQRRSLTQEERQSIYNSFLKHIGVASDSNSSPPPATKPDFTDGALKIRLGALSEITGINKLARNQNLSFAKNLTIVYGENGAGKSGYGRVLRILGRGYSDPERILGDIFAEQEENKSAKLEYLVEEKSQSFVWQDGNGVQIPKELKSVTFFSNHCVRISLTSDRTLLIPPSGFELFSAISKELTALGELHQAKINSHNSELVWTNQLSAGTAAQDFISNLSDKSKTEALESLSEFNNEHGQKLQTQKDELQKLNPLLLETELKSLKNQKTEIENVLRKISDVQSIFSKELLSNLREQVAELTKLKSGQLNSLTEVASKNGVSFLESAEFNSFLQSADAYITKLNVPDYPKVNQDRCVLCNQTISDQASVMLLKQYREVLSKASQLRITQLVKNIEIGLRDIRSLENPILLAHPSFGQNTEGLVSQPDSLQKYNSQIATLKQRLLNTELTPQSDFSLEVDWETILLELQSKLKDLNAKIIEKSEKAANQKKLESELKKGIAELTDRKLLSEKKAEVSETISKLLVKKKLVEASSALNTGNLSRKASEARDYLLSSKLKEGFEAELAVLRRPHLKVSLDFRTDKGATRLIQELNEDCALHEVLSEGEQKAVSLCELFAELRLDTALSPIILDDPVTSLDHHFIDEIAKRLVKLSEERQVVIFTHSILLFNAIKQRINSDVIKKKKLEIKFYESLRGDGVTGILQDSGTFLTEENFNFYLKRINTVINSSKADKLARPRELAIQGYEDLRSAIEVLVEEDIFESSVKRYRKNIVLTRFESVNGALIDEHKETINGIFEKACGFIDGHSKVEGVNLNPDLELLKADIDSICKIRDCFKGTTKQKQQANT